MLSHLQISFHEVKHQADVGFVSKGIQQLKWAAQTHIKAKLTLVYIYIFTGHTGNMKTF